MWSCVWHRGNQVLFLPCSKGGQGCWGLWENSLLLCVLWWWFSVCVACMAGCLRLLAKVYLRKEEKRKTSFVIHCRNIPVCNICKSSLKKSKIRGTLIKKLRIVSTWSTLTPPTPPKEHKDFYEMLWFIWLVQIFRLECSIHYLWLLTQALSCSDWHQLPLGGFQCFLELLFVVDTAASWERLCSCSMQPHPGMTWCWGSPQRVCVQHSLYCSLPSPAFLNVTSSSSSSTAWQSEGQHSQLPACVWNPLLSFNHCLQGVPECCTSPFSLRGQELSTCSTQEGAGNFLTFGLPRDDGNDQLHHPKAGTGSCSSHWASREAPGACRTMCSRHVSLPCAAKLSPAPLLPLPARAQIALRWKSCALHCHCRGSALCRQAS